MFSSRFLFTNPNFYTHRIYCTTRLTTNILSRILSRFPTHSLVLFLALFSRSTYGHRVCDLFVQGLGASKQAFVVITDSSSAERAFSFSFGFVHKEGSCSPVCRFYLLSCCYSVLLSSIPIPHYTTSPTCYIRRGTASVCYIFNLLICAFRRQLFPFLLLAAACIRVCVFALYIRAVDQDVPSEMQDVRFPICPAVRCSPNLTRPLARPYVCVCVCYCTFLSVSSNQSAFYHTSHHHHSLNTQSFLLFCPPGGGGEGYRRGVGCLCCPNFRDSVCLCV